MIVSKIWVTKEDYPKKINKYYSDVYNIKEGDIVMIDASDDMTMLEVIKDADDILFLKSVDNDEVYPVEILIDENYSVLHKKIGEKKCEDIQCIDCPIHLLCKAYVNQNNVSTDMLTGTLNEHFETFEEDAKKNHYWDFTIYSIIEKRLEQ